MVVRREEILKIKQEIFSIRKEFGGHVTIQVDDRPILSKSQENLDPAFLQKTNSELQREATFNRYMDKEEANWKALMNEGKLKFQSYDDKPNNKKFCCF
uniref:Uncharacterized protein n=1 Tax=Acrobeloides nanus TaxID=290746 RepID=A0A914BUW9_9BILA